MTSGAVARSFNFCWVPRSSHRRIAIWQLGRSGTALQLANALGARAFGNRCLSCEFPFQKENTNDIEFHSELGKASSEVP
jgi:hypothetical protein